MSEVATYALRLPKSLKEAIARTAKKDGISMNQFITLATAEKISALETEQYFAERAQKANLEEFLQFLNREGGEPPRTDDTL